MWWDQSLSLKWLICTNPQLSGSGPLSSDTISLLAVTIPAESESGTFSQVTFRWHFNCSQTHWFLSSGNLLLDLLDHKDIVSDIQCSVNGVLASTSFDGNLKLWDLSDCGNLKKSIVIDGKALFGCRWAHDCKSLVIVGMSKIVSFNCVE